MLALIYESYFNIDIYENLFLCTNEIKIRFKSKFGNVIRIKAIFIFQTYENWLK